MRIRNVAIAGALMLTVAACGGDEPAKVSGARDDVKKLAAVKEVSHKEKKTERVCTRRVSGSCKSYRTDTVWKKVVDKQGKPAVYCVELDNVNGSAKDDDVWYTVTTSTYLKAAGLDEGDKLQFVPVHGGCW